VVDNDHVDLLFYTDTSAFVNLYRILRSESGAGPFEEVGTVLPSVEENLAFSDMSADVNARSYYYKITVIDTCNIESEIANSGRTIFLSVSANEDRTNLLQWNAYESWDAAVDSYEVYRLINSVADPAGPLAVLSSSTFSYVDDVSDLNGTNSVVEYYVRAIEGNNNSFGFRDDALSNVARALQESKVFIPNAFAPGGINRTFKPVSSFISPDDYLFSIYDRFGREIFSTTSPTEGWDGRIDGREVPQGVYVYLLRFRDTFQRSVSQTGTVMVLY
jgi:gliding motility-associated-like protein